MSGKIILDTNIVLYLLGGKLDPDTLPEGEFHISFITEMESLCYEMPAGEEERIREFLKSIEIIELNTAIKLKAIDIRKMYRVKLPDAIICATAYDLQGVLVTADEQLKKVGGSVLHL